ncbi:hypothetical protein QJS04_geneDACA018990 [Acorus gramineus]|uniref:Uncharacterized protein n=1 Tax=Acorus gramineus TaxID=55184 RepID=A0AAV9B9L2_ACOGR|nr:hypothetical protein QJS04_geneDACA018990 [Acorus gramineus]
MSVFPSSILPSHDEPQNPPTTSLINLLVRGFQYLKKKINKLGGFKKQEQGRPVVHLTFEPRRSATEMWEAGVKFVAKSGCNIHEISFKNGVMYRPTLLINEDTLHHLRNLATRI